MKYIDADLLRAEIDKRYAEYRAKMKTDDFTYYEGMADALDHFEQYIDSLPEQPSLPSVLDEAAEKYAKGEGLENALGGWEDMSDAFKARAEWHADHAKIDVTDFCKPIDPGIAKCVADHWWELLDDENAADKKAVKEIVKTVHKEVTRQVKEMVKEQPASEGLEKEMEEMWLEFCEDTDYLTYASIARHFAEWGAEHLKK